MRNILIILAAILFNSSLSSQPWQPIYENTAYYYSSASDTLVGIRIDSTSIEGSGQVKYTNRMFKHLPNLNEMNGICAQGESDFGVVQPGFLASMITETEDGLTAFMRPDTFYLDLDAGLNETWVFSEDSEQDVVQATVTEIAEEDVLGQPDMVKTISLDNGGEIKLSENYGIIAFMDSDTSTNWVLWGIPELGLGEYPVTAKEIFDFEVGDRFAYYGKAGYSGGYYKSVFIKEVLARSVGEDSVTYEFLITHNRIDYHVNSGSGGVFVLDETTTGQIETSETYPLISSGIPNEIPYNITNTLYSMEWDNHPYESDYLSEGMEQISNYHEESRGIVWMRSINGRSVKTVGQATEAFTYSDIELPLEPGYEPDSDFDGDYRFLSDPECNPLNPTVQDSLPLRENPEITGYSAFGEGLGIISSYAPFGFDQNYLVMLGYEKGDETHGYIPSVSEVLSNGHFPETDLKELYAYPNPAGTQIQIDNLSGGSLYFYDVSGRLVMERATSNQSVDLSGLSPGHYNVVAVKSSKPYGRFELVKR